MKLLRNPIVTAVLALAAVVIVFVQFGGMKLLKGKPAPAPVAQSQPAPAAAAVQPATVQAPAPVRAAHVAAKTATGTNATVTIRPDRNVDASLVEKQFSYWVQAPLRDPFLLMRPAVPAKTLASLIDTNSPVRTWKLKAIWNQTETRLAVINNKVYRVGDSVVDGYKLIRIENDEVWVQGPIQNERLGFVDPKESSRAASGAQKQTSLTPGVGAA